MDGLVVDVDDGVLLLSAAKPTKQRENANMCALVVEWRG